MTKNTLQVFPPFKKEIPLAITKSYFVEKTTFFSKKTSLNRKVIKSDRKKFVFVIPSKR